MKACLGDNGCDGTGWVFGGIQPFRFAWCIACKHTGFVEGEPIQPATISIHTLGTTATDAEHVFKMSDFAKVKNPLMAHAMAKAKIFPSIGQARKNGWDKPLEVGEWTVTKKKIRIKVID